MWAGRIRQKGSVVGRSKETVVEYPSVGYLRAPLGVPSSKLRTKSNTRPRSL
jgi:hypothetical protein